MPILPMFCDALVPKTPEDITSSESCSIDEPLPKLEKIEKDTAHLIETAACTLNGETCTSEPSTSKSSSVVEVSTSTSKTYDISSEVRESSTEQPTKRGVHYKCDWINCTHDFPNIDEVYDHVIAVHVNPAKPDPPEDPDDDEEIVSCYWESCQASISRGDLPKKVAWLSGHFRSRHSKHARPFKCLIEGCGARFQSNHRLEEHVRAQHIKETKKAKVAAPQKEEQWWTFKPQMLKLRKEEENPMWTPFYSNQLQERLCIARGMDWDFAVVNRRRPGVGAAHRKAYFPYIEDIVPSKKSKDDELDSEGSVGKAISISESSEVSESTPGPDNLLSIQIMEETMKCEDDDESLHSMPHLSLSLDDLFPGWNYEEKRRAREAIEDEAIIQQKSSRRCHRRHRRVR